MSSLVLIVAQLPNIDERCDSHARGQNSFSRSYLHIRRKSRIMKMVWLVPGGPWAVASRCRGLCLGADKARKEKSILWREDHCGIGVITR